MEGRAERQTEGQLGPHGSRRSPNPTTPHRTSGKTEEGRTVLPLRSARTYVQGMPQKAQQTPSQTETDEEKVNRLVAELKGLNDDVQDKVLNGAFVGQEDF